MIALAEHKSEFGVVTVFEAPATRVRSYKHGDVFQSEADARGVSTASYIHAIYGLVRQSRGRKVLMIGCGGGTLGTMLAHADYRVTIVDINPVAFVFARRYFHLPANVKCCVADGLDYLQGTREEYDMLVLDAYHGNAVPAHFKSDAFFDAVLNATRDKGCVFANVHTLDDRDVDADRLAASFERRWRDVRLLDALGETNRNTIVAAGSVSKLGTPRLEIVPQHEATLIETELAAMAFRERRPL